MKEHKGIHQKHEPLLIDRTFIKFHLNKREAEEEDGKMRMHRVGGNGGFSAQLVPTTRRTGGLNKDAAAASPGTRVK